MIKLSVFTLIVFIALFGCNNKNKENAADDAIVSEINTNARFVSSEKLFEGVELPVFVKKINSKKAEKLVISSGAEIKIPENAFVDKDGNDVKGDITIQYKEIKSPADIIIENIDMTYDSLGKSYQFATAGMFDLRAYQNDEELLLKQGKTIEVSYLSKQKGNYQVYYNDNGWKYSGIPKENIPLNANVGDDAVTGVLSPTAANLSEDLILDIKTSHKDIPELAVYKSVLWKYAGDLSKDELASMLGKPVSNTSLMPAKKKGEFLYKFTNKEGSYELVVKPVFSPKAMKDALNTYKSVVSNKEKSQKVKRTVDVTRLGLMNYDVIYHRSDAVLVKVNFKIKNKETQVRGLPLFHITGEDNVLVNISNQNDIYYSNSLNNKILAVLPGRKVAVMSTSSFIKSMKNRQTGEEIVLELDEIETTINTSDDLNNIISEL
jgi:hypothetical protein